MNKVLTEIIPKKSSNDATEDYQKSYDTEQKHCNCDICRTTITITRDFKKAQQTELHD